jgi:peptidyl-prolyl cis-trans isomerase A (cyclophilin A)
MKPTVVALACLLAACATTTEVHDRPSSLLQPESPAMNETAPDTFQVKFETTAGDFVVEARCDWAPRGVDRFYNLVREGFFGDVRFFRVIEGFMAQFGISGDPKVASGWQGSRIPDDPVGASNTRGRVSFATAGPGTRTTQLFINYGDNSRLDGMGFSPIGEVVEGMDVVDSLHAGYGEGAPRGRGPDQGRIHREGNTYLESEFPDLDWIRRAEIVEPTE